MERTYGDLVYLNDAWYIRNLEPHAAIKLKAIFEQVPKHQVNDFRFPSNGESAVDLSWFISRYPLRSSVEARRILFKGVNSQKHEMSHLEIILSDDYTPKEFKFKFGKPRDYQKVSFEWFLVKKKVLLSDFIGLGKTLLGVMAATKKKCLPLIVVAPTHLPLQWEEQFRKFLGDDISIHLIKTRKAYSLPVSDVYIFKYSQLIGWPDVLNVMNYKTVIFDEIQDLRREKSQKYKVAKIMSDKADYVAGLSMTPIINYGDEIYNIMNVINPKYLGDRGSFYREWCDTWDRVKDPKALGTYLREIQCMLRRTLEDVGRELPPLNSITHYIDTESKEWDKVESIAKMLAQKSFSGSFMERGQARRELDIMVRQATGVSKAKGVAEYCKMLLASGEQVVVAAWHRGVYKILLRELEEYNPVMYTGSESLKQKKESVAKFIKGDSRVFLISLRSGAGLDGLQDSACKYVVFAELDWSMQIMTQLIGRLRRDDNKKQITAIYLLANEGSDPPIVDMLGIKSSQSKGILDPLSGVETKFSDESRLTKLAKHFLDKQPLQ